MFKINAEYKPYIWDFDYKINTRYETSSFICGSGHLYSVFPRFALDISPTEQVSEYTATIAYKLLNEGKDGRQKVDSLKMILRAEGKCIVSCKKESNACSELQPYYFAVQN